MTQASPDLPATQADNLGTWSTPTRSVATGEQLSELGWRSRNEPLRPGGGQESPAQLRLRFHNTLASATKPPHWVPPPASALLLPHAGVHSFLLLAQLLSSLPCQLHHEKPKH